MREWIAGKLAIGLYIWRFIGRHKTIRTLILWLLGVLVVAYIVYGDVAIEAAFLLIQLGLQLGFAVVFMVVQFVALFWFISRTRTTVIRPGDPKTVTLDQYWGQPNLVKLMTEWLHLLNEPDEFKKMGGKYISGVLLHGPPGTGKTMLAKALAGQGGVGFIGCEGSGFRGMFFGTDTMKVMQFFGNAKKMARQYGACIGYIDELDAIGASRGGVQGGGQVMGMMGGMGGMGASGALTRLLYEMDGLGEVSDWENCQNTTRKWFGLPEIPRGTVLIMGSTNRRDVLDPALMRPGRFDQIVQVDPPDKKGREAVIRGYLNAVKHDDTIDVEVLVSSTSWATPAKIASAITKTAVRYAIFDKRDSISQKDIEKALIEQAVGIAQPVADMDEKQLEQIAYHEAGHAIAEYYFCPHRKIAYLTITRRSEALGFMLPVSKTDIYSMPLEDITGDIQVNLAGHVATEICLGRAWTGASSDFEHVRARVRYLASLGYLGYLPMDDSKHSEEVEAFVKKCLDATRVLLLKHRKELEDLARTLLERRDMSGEEVVEVIKKASEE